jgi:hypothetical protein
MNKLEDAFARLSKSFSTKDRLNNKVSVSGDITTLNTDDLTVIIGAGTLRLVYSDNAKNASIAINPAIVSVGSYERGLDLTLTVLESGFKTSYNRLYVDGGELFQYSTVHDFDFGIIPELMTKYLELLKEMKTSPRLVSKEFIDQAIENVSEAVEAYKLEAK